MNIAITKFVQDPTHNDRQYGGEDGKQDGKPTDLGTVIAGSNDHAL